MNKQDDPNLDSLLDDPMDFGLEDDLDFEEGSLTDFSLDDLSFDDLEETDFSLDKPKEIKEPEEMPEPVRMEEEPETLELEQETEMLPDEESIGSEISVEDEIPIHDEIGMSDEFAMDDEIGMDEKTEMEDGLSILEESEPESEPEEEPGEEEAPFDVLEFLNGGDVGLEELSLDAGEIEESVEEEGEDSGTKRVKKGQSQGDGQEKTQKQSSYIKRLIHKLFDNVPVEKKGTKTNEEVLLPEEEIAARKAEEEEKKKQSKEEKEAKKAEKAAAKKTEKEEAKKEKDARNQAKREEKREKKEQAKKAKKMKEAAEPVETGRINRAGALIVFVFFFLIGAVVWFGSSISAYSLTIQNASRDFSLQHYNEAYDEIRGVDIKPKDLELRDKVMTVMYVNKQLNSYNNFQAAGDYPKALNSLISGLQRYEKYLALAQELGIESDLDYVRSQILAELERVYYVSEREAMNLVEMQDDLEYSTHIYEVASRVVPKEEPEYVP